MVDCCCITVAAQLTDEYHLFLSAPCMSYSLPQRPYSPSLTAGDLAWSCVIGNISEVIRCAVVQTITSFSPRGILETMLPHLKFFFDGKEERGKELGECQCF